MSRGLRPSVVLPCHVVWRDHAVLLSLTTRVVDHVIARYVVCHVTGPGVPRYVIVSRHELDFTRHVTL